jgi:hypothetical protein
VSSKRPSRRTPPYYLFTGLLVGLLTGLVLALIFHPVYVDAAPQALNDADKNAYRSLAAMAYVADHDLGRAQARLALLKDKNGPFGVAAQAQQELSQNGADTSSGKALSLLATAFVPTLSAAQVVATPQPGATVTARPDFLLTPSATLDPNAAVMTATPSLSPTPTERPLTPLATFTPRVTATPLPSLGYPFILTDKSDVCDARLPGLLQLEVNDKAENPVPGLRISVVWDGGEDLFFTGLHPNINPGYADFTMAPNTTYAVKVGDISKPVEKISAAQCKAKDGSSFLGGLMLQFGQK